jgi:hypothetical protein
VALAASGWKIAEAIMNRFGHFCVSDDRPNIHPSSTIERGICCKLDRGVIVQVSQYLGRNSGRESELTV